MIVNAMYRCVIFVGNVGMRDKLSNIRIDVDERLSFAVSKKFSG